jgi:hypothetical protein
MTPTFQIGFGSPSAFLTLPTIYSLACLVGLFHPTATPGIRTTGVSSHHPAGQLHQLLPTLMSLSATRLIRERTASRLWTFFRASLDSDPLPTNNSIKIC